MGKEIVLNMCFVVGCSCCYEVGVGKKKRNKRGRWLLLGLLMLFDVAVLVMRREGVE